MRRRAAHPGINSSFDEAAGEVIVRRRINLGIAAATERGLIVPNVKGADQLDLVGMARALDALVATARAGTTTPADMLGTTLTITNVGPFGIDGAIPILPPGTAAIVAVGQIVAAAVGPRRRSWPCARSSSSRWRSTTA